MTPQDKNPPATHAAANENAEDAAITATGADTDNDHADERPLNRSQDAPGNDDAQDVVDHMNQMERSGQIDMDAYRDERNDDDEAGMLGQSGMEPEDLDEHGNKPREAVDPVE